jgi:2-C-methyl-D-erythritol 4-phosphate cytidylyltransferase
VEKTVPRAGLWLAQTPQGFRRDVALKCLLKPSKNATDDAELAERRGYKVALVEGAATNMKVTYPADLKLCRLLKK